MPIEQVIGASYPWCSGWAAELKELFAAYVEAKQKHNVLDYDDLLLYWAQMIVRRRPRRRHRRPLRSCAGRRIPGHEPPAVLDPAGAQARRPGPHGGRRRRAIDLLVPRRHRAQYPRFSRPVFSRRRRSSRSTATIARRSRSLPPPTALSISPRSASPRTSGPNAPRRQSRNLVAVRDEADQARYIVERILENPRGRSPPQATGGALPHVHRHSGPLEVELTRRNIPFVKFGGLKFLDAAHVKDVLALLRFVENPRDRVAGFRVMHLLPGIGPASAQRILDHMAEATDPLDALTTLPSPPRAGDDWAIFVETIGNLRYSEWPADLERARLWYEPHLDRIHEDAEVRRADLIQLEQIAGGYASRERFLTELTLDPPDATSDQAGVPLLDEDYLILSTIHSAKGQEWKSVYVLNVVDGCMPSDLGAGTSAELEEERRLLYVAMTRAKDDLHLVVPQRFFTHGQHSQGDRHVYASRTRFIPEKLLGLFERTNWPIASPSAARGPSQGPQIDIGARMRGMWR